MCYWSVTYVLQGSYRGVNSVMFGYYRGVSNVTGVLQKFYMDVMGVFHDCYREEKMHKKSYIDNLTLLERIYPSLN